MANAKRLKTSAGLDYVAFGEVVQEISGPGMKVRFEGLREYFEVQLAVVTQRLAQSGANIGKESLEKAVTPWGEARMSGEYYGVRFRRYGNTSGRNETGFMKNSLTAWLDKPSKGKRVEYQGYFGWPSEVIMENPYILYQAQGFRSLTVFDPAATKATGRAKFKSGNGRFVQGAYPLRGAEPSIKKRAQSAYSAAWNEAKKLWEADGFKGGAGSYLDNRESRFTFVGTPFNLYRMGYRVRQPSRPRRRAGGGGNVRFEPR